MVHEVLFLKEEFALKHANMGASDRLRLEHAIATYNVYVAQASGAPTPKHAKSFLGSAFSVPGSAVKMISGADHKGGSSKPVLQQAHVDPVLEAAHEFRLCELENMSRRDHRHLARNYLDLYWLYTAQNKTAREQAEKAFSSQYVEAIVEGEAAIAKVVVATIEEMKQQVEQRVKAAEALGIKTAAEIAVEKALDLEAIAHDCKREGDKTLEALTRMRDELTSMSGGALALKSPGAAGHPAAQKRQVESVQAFKVQLKKLLATIPPPSAGFEQSAATTEGPSALESGHFETSYLGTSKVQTICELRRGMEAAYLLTGGRDGTLSAIAVSDGTPVAVEAGAHAGEIKQLVVLQGGELVASVSADGCKIWRPVHGKKSRLTFQLVQHLVPPKPSAPPSCCIELSTKNGTELWLATLSGKIFVYALDSHTKQYGPTASVVELQPEASMKPVEVFVSTMCTHLNMLFLGVGPCILKFDAVAKKPLGYLQGRSKIVSCIIGVGRQVWSAGHDNKIKVWDPQAGTEIKQLEQTAQVFALAYDGACVWAALWNKSVALYDAVTIRLKRTLEGRHSDAVTSFALVRPPPGLQVRIWSGSWDKSVAVWSVAPGSADADTF
jgi:WD40 repeat protein